MLDEYLVNIKYYVISMIRYAFAAVYLLFI